MGRFQQAAVGRQSRYQRFRRKVGNIVFASGSTTPLNLGSDDYTTRLKIVSLQQVISTGTVPVVAGYGAFGPLATVTVAVNGGKRPISLSGYALDVCNRVRNAPYASDLTASPLTISTTTNWVNHLMVPFTVAPNSFVGAWYTGDTTLQMQLRLGMSTPAQAFSVVNGGTITGSWDVWRETYNAPRPDVLGGWLNEISYYRELSLQQSGMALKNGTTRINLPTDQDYVRVFLNFYTGSNLDGTFAPANGLYTSISLVVDGKIYLIEAATEAEVLFTMDERYAEKLPAGWAVLDFSQVNDILPTDPDSVSTLYLDIVSTSGSNNVDVICETVVDNPLTAKWAAQAAANQRTPAAA